MAAVVAVHALFVRPHRFPFLFLHDDSKKLHLLAGRPGVGEVASSHRLSLAFAEN